MGRTYDITDLWDGRPNAVRGRQASTLLWHGGSNSLAVHNAAVSSGSVEFIILCATEYDCSILNQLIVMRPEDANGDSFIDFWMISRVFP